MVNSKGLLRLALSWQDCWLADEFSQEIQPAAAESVRSMRSSRDRVRELFDEWNSWQRRHSHDPFCQIEYVSMAAT